jgi:ribonuclease HI
MMLISGLMELVPVMAMTMRVQLGHLCLAKQKKQEALAVYHALLWAAEEKHKKVKIYSDSQITLNGLKKSPDRVKENREIFQLIEDVIMANGLTVDFEKVPAHADNINNNRADRLANGLVGIKSK